MVHPYEPNDGATDDHDERTGDATGKNDRSGGSVDRRSLLKLAGATAMGGAIAANTGADIASASPTVVQKDGYEVWKVSGKQLYRMSEGEVLENVLIDQTEPGATLYIRANGADNWTIRNVGWKGHAEVTDNVAGGGFHMELSGDGLVENVFIDNRDPNRDTKMGGALTIRTHSGTIECRNTFIAGCGNNAFYASNSGKNDGGEGAVRFYNCYHRDNTVSQFRVGGPGSLVENCVGVVDDPDGERGTYPGTTSRRARGVWARNMPDNTVRNSVMYISPDDCDPWANYMLDCFYKSNGPEAVLHLDGACGNPDGPLLTRTPNRDCPGRLVGEVETSNLTVNVLGDGGVPLSPEMAARGERAMPPELPGADGGSSGGEPQSDLERTLTVDGTDADWTDYEITVSGDLEKNADAGSVNDADEIDGSTVTGFVNGGVDGYRFSGEVTDATVDGGATVLVDGQAIDVDGGPIADRTLTVDGSGDRSDYSFAVSEALEGANGSLGTGDAVDGTSASGFVVGGADQYRFAGEVTDFSLEGDATVLVDGEPIDPSTFGDDPALPHTLTVDGSGDRSDYSFAVSEALEAGDGVGSGDVVDGTSASGFVVGGADQYRFAGEVTDFSLEGDATVLVDGEPFDAAPDLPNRIVFDGRGTEGESNYQIAVTGDLEADPLSGGVPDGVIDGSSASGTVADGRDGFRFSGDLTKLTLDGNADIVFEDNDG